MADIRRITTMVRVINDTAFSSHTGNVDVEKQLVENTTVEYWRIRAATPTVADFNEAPVGSDMWDTTDYLTHYVHDTATSWKSVTYA